jgi:hypothetical protein
MTTIRTSLRTRRKPRNPARLPATLSMSRVIAASSSLTRLALYRQRTGAEPTIQIKYAVMCISVLYQEQDGVRHLVGGAIATQGDEFFRDALFEPS